MSQLKTRLQSNIVLQAQVDDMQRQNEELPELRRICQEYEDEVRDLRQEAQDLKRSRDEIEAKLDRYLERCRVAAEKDRMYDKAFKNARDEVQRVERQLNATAESLSPARGARGNHDHHHDLGASSQSSVIPGRSPPHRR